MSCGCLGRHHEGVKGTLLGRVGCGRGGGHGRTGCGRTRSAAQRTQGLGSGSPRSALPLWLQAHGNTALHMAAALPPGPPQEAIVRHLLAAGADPTLRNLENEQPVHLLRPGPGPEGVSTGWTLRWLGVPLPAPNTDLEGGIGSCSKRARKSESVG